MRAAQIKQYGHADAIEINEIDKPRPANDQVLIEVHASSINPVDISIREGRAVRMVSTQPPLTLGFDVAGVVAETGGGVATLKVGDKVYGQASVMAGGSGPFAEYATISANYLAQMPRNINFLEAAAISLVGLSALQAIVDYIKLQRGQKILILGGAGGIGSIAIQLAKHIGAYVATTATGAGIEYVKGLGADKVIDYKTQAFDKLLTNYDAVFDNVAGETYTRAFKVLRKGGIIVSMRQQPEAELMKKYDVTAIYERTKTTTESLNALTKVVEAGVVKVRIDKVFRLDQIKQAFEAKESGGVRGKIAIEIRK